MKIKILRKPEVLNSFGISDSTLYARINEGVIAPPIPLGDRAVGFLEHEAQAVLSSMVAGKSKEEIKSQVTAMVHERRSFGGAI